MVVAYSFICEQTSSGWSGTAYNKDLSAEADDLFTLQQELKKEALQDSAEKGPIQAYFSQLTPKSGLLAVTLGAQLSVGGGPSAAPAGASAAAAPAAEAKQEEKKEEKKQEEEEEDDADMGFSLFD